ncbi:potassium-transporting ATPase subunit F [Candidatus Nitrospira inopinata]|jgi:K+-transporting ATPase KdpF subunit|nr:potassium-transporting ATPase subunit F [Candidatus Nitrospira inopinata]
MNVLHALAVIASVGVFVYLMVALLKAEWF